MSFDRKRTDFVGKKSKYDTAERFRPARFWNFYRHRVGGQTF